MIESFSGLWVTFESLVRKEKIKTPQGATDLFPVGTFCVCVEAWKIIKINWEIVKKQTPLTFLKFEFTSFHCYLESSISNSFELL